MKAALIIIIGLCLVFPSFAEVSISELIYAGKDEEANALCEKLNLDGKLALYASLKRDPATEIAINGIIGFGIGSQMRGNQESGSLLFALDLTCLGIIALPIFIPDTVGADAGSTLSIIGGAGLFCSRVISVLLPLNDADAYNARLKIVIGVK